MIKQVLLKAFEKSVYGKNYKDGERVVRNDLISDIEYESDPTIIIIHSKVISENLYNQYNIQINIDKKSKDVIKTKCNCNDFEKHSGKRERYACKHIVASFYKFLRDLDIYENMKSELGLDEEVSKVIMKNTNDSILNKLLGVSKTSTEIKLEVILNRVQWSRKIVAEFKIGTKEMNSNKLYQLKDINSFLVALYNNISLPYGKDFEFNAKVQKIKVTDKKIIKFINLISEIDRKLVSGKSLVIPDFLLGEFLKTIKHNRVYLGNGFYSRQLEIEILEEEIDIPLSLKEDTDLIKLETIMGMPEAIIDNEGIYLYNSNIYLPPEEQIEKLEVYINHLKQDGNIIFLKSEEERILRELLPSMRDISKNIQLSKTLRDKIVIEKPKFKFYFDKEDEIALTLKVCYGVYEFNIFEDCLEKIVYRDFEKENNIVDILRDYGFEKINDNFIFFKNEEDLFRFFKVNIINIQELGEVYYSESFKGIKKIDTKDFKGEIQSGKFDYFEMKFNFKGLEPLEVKRILRAFRDNKKYYRLESGEFLDLYDLEVNKLLKFLDEMEFVEENSELRFSKYKSIYVENYLNESGLKGIKGRKELKDLSKALTSYKKQEFELPQNINAKLRDYQKYGYKWMKTLDYLGFGGILGDEMGLGKTLQSIVFIASNIEKKTLIIAPTSLIYNWENEFKKFAPNVKVKVVNGAIEDRDIDIKNLDKYDVLITTYNLLRRDIEFYNNTKFDYLILDEAQNIKNSSAQNTKAVKSINSNRRFALTGTPIENSLMELWSIFDFIMPGYLYDEQRFLTRYNRRLKEEDVIIEEINKLINPFILRRYKKEVIKELPDKIEKKLVIPLNIEQKKVYSVYSNYIQELIEKKVKEEEFENSKIEILSYITKLRQICIAPSLVMDNYEGGSSKINELLELIHEAIKGNHKILVFSQFTSVLAQVRNKFDFNNISYKYLDGSTKSKERVRLVEEFNKDETSVFLISLKAGGTGLNLTSADIVIHLDPWWNPAVEDQANDRAHRIGQKNVVEVIKLIAKDTIEEKVVLLQEQKKELIDKVLGEKSELSNDKFKFSREDILELFKYEDIE